MKTFLLFAFILSNLYLTFADWMHPHYSYRCLENGDVELFGVHKKSTIKVGKNTGCTYHYNTTSQVYLIKLECLENTSGNTHIIVYDYDFDGVSDTPSLPTTTIAPNLVGGHGGHQFVIDCEDIPPEGINKTVAHVFQGSDYNHLPINNKEVASVEMRFKAVSDFSAPDISSVYIGDEFYMFIEYMGANKNYFVVPEECTAIGGTSFAKGRRLTSSENYVVLWNTSINACAPQGTLLEKFIRENNTIIYAKMYGFKFTGYNFITITCEVKIFKEQNEDKCVITTPKPTTSKPTNPKSTTPNAQSTGKRKKRAIENTLFQNERLDKTLWVYDNRNVQLAENGSQKIKMDVPLWIVFYIVVTLRYN